MMNFYILLMYPPGPFKGASFHFDRGLGGWYHSYPVMMKIYNRFGWEMPVVKLVWKDEVSKGDAFGFARIQEPNRLRDRVHCHKDFSEVFWVEQGQGIHLINGQKIPLAAGDVVLMRPHDTHNFEPVDEAGFRFVNVTFKSSTIQYLKNRYFKDVKDFYDAKAKLPLKKAMSKSLKRWMEDAVPALAQAPRTRLEIETFLLALFHGLFFPPITMKLEICPDWIKYACENIRKPEHFSKGVQAFMQLAGRSPEHVARETKRWLGKTPTELVNVARLDYAAQQLSKGQTKINDIALEASFDNLAHFYRLFRKQFGTTPRTYRLRTQYGFPPEPPFPPYFKSEFVAPRSQR
jgi:AraC family transcriptional regulator, dual regulator of chb operon